MDDYEIGNYLLILDKSNTNYNKVGEVVGVDQRHYSVKFKDDGHTFKYYKASTCSYTGVISPDFVIGDEVIVSDQEEIEYGSIGRIQEIDEGHYGVYFYVKKEPDYDTYYTYDMLTLVS